MRHPHRLPPSRGGVVCLPDRAAVTVEDRHPRVRRQLFGRVAIEGECGMVRIGMNATEVVELAAGTGVVCGRGDRAEPVGMHCSHSSDVRIATRTCRWRGPPATRSTFSVRCPTYFRQHEQFARLPHFSCRRFHVVRSPRTPHTICTCCAPLRPYETSVGDMAPRTCPRCNAPIEESGKGRPPIWCSQKCRRAAYEERRAGAAGAISIEIREVVREIEREVVRVETKTPPIEECVERVLASPRACRDVLDALAIKAEAGRLDSGLHTATVDAAVRLIEALIASGNRHAKLRRTQ